MEFVYPESEVVEEDFEIEPGDYKGDIDLSNYIFKGNLDMENVRIKGTFKCPKEIGGSLHMNGARMYHFIAKGSKIGTQEPGGHYIDAYWLKAYSVTFEDTHIKADANFDEADIGWLVISNSSIEGTLSLQGARATGKDFGSVYIKKSVFGENLKFDDVTIGPLNIQDSVIGGSLELERGKFSSFAAENSIFFCGISMDGATIDHLSSVGLAFTGIVLDGATINNCSDKITVLSTGENSINRNTRIPSKLDDRLKIVDRFFSAVKAKKSLRDFGVDIIPKGLTKQIMLATKKCINSFDELAKDIPLARAIEKEIPDYDHGGEILRILKYFKEQL